MKERKPHVINPSIEETQVFTKGGFVAGYSESRLGKLLHAVLPHLPRRLHFILPVAAIVSMINLAADAEAKSPQEGQLLPGLELPFPGHRDMKIQQGWIYTAGGIHGGIDFIKGELDDSDTWQSFPILAAASGEACANPPSREGNAVFIKHETNGETIYTYYGHLESIQINIPDCGEGVKFVFQGEEIGEAGDTGTEDGWIHLHFQLNDEDGNPIDPYDIYDTRDAYPDPSQTGKLAPPRFSLSVDANNPSGTAIQVRRGQTLTIKASGFWCSGGIKAPGVASCGGPEGIRPAGRGEDDLILNEEQVGTLIARIGDNVVPIRDNTTITIQSNGNLSLLMNDRHNYYHDNSGTITVEIESLH